MTNQSGPSGVASGLVQAATLRTDGLCRLTGAFQGPPWMKTPTSTMHRKLLALFLTRASEAVSEVDIMEELWEEKPPRSAVTTFQTYTMVLRKAMDIENPKRMLERIGTGYRLNVPRAEVDALAFTDLVRGIKETDDPEQLALDAVNLKLALSLVGEDALVDVKCGSRLQYWAIGFEETRLRVKQLWVEAMLKLGKHHEVLAELAQLCYRHPFHEAFHARLMVALYRSERSPEALAHYRKLQQALDVELGIKPNPALQGLYCAILNNDVEVFRNYRRLC